MKDDKYSAESSSSRIFQLENIVKNEPQSETPYAGEKTQFKYDFKQVESDFNCGKIKRSSFSELLYQKEIDWFLNFE